MTDLVSSPGRFEQLQSRLTNARERIDRAVTAAGRSDTVDLVVVTKTFPASDVEILAELGVRDVGENRDQEARAKRELVTAAGASVRWHMIGRLQSNKAASVASWADVVESVDRPILAERLARGAERVRPPGDPVQVLVQVNLDAGVDPSAAPGAPGARSGAHPDDVLDIATAVVEAGPAVQLAGLMAVAPHPDAGIAPDLAFSRLMEVVALVRETYPQARIVSAGMSGDLEAAIAAGATQVRIGGAILGQRPVVQ